MVNGEWGCSPRTCGYSKCSEGNGEFKMTPARHMGPLLPSRGRLQGPLLYICGGGQGVTEGYRMQHYRCSVEILCTSTHQLPSYEGA